MRADRRVVPFADGGRAFRRGVAADSTAFTCAGAALVACLRGATHRLDYSVAAAGLELSLPDGLAASSISGRLTLLMWLIMARAFTFIVFAM